MMRSNHETLRRGRESSAEQVQTSLGLLVANWPFVAVLATGVILRAIVLLAYQPVLPLMRDALMYVERSATWAPGGSFHPFLYPVLLKPFVAVGHVEWISIVQHLAGLAMGVLLYALMRHLTVSPILAAIGVAPVLLDGFQLNIEHQVMSETFCQLFATGGLVVLAWAERPPPSAAAAAGCLIAASGLVRFPGLAVIVGAIAYVLLKGMGSRRLIALILGFTVPLALYALWFRSHSGSVAITNRNGFFLYGRVASFADCSEDEVPHRLQVFCPPKRQRDSGMAGLFTSGLPDDVRQNPNNNGRALEFSRRMIAAKPWAYVSAVVSDFLTYFEVTPPATREPGAGKWIFKESISRQQQRLPTSAQMRLSFEVDESLANFLHQYQARVWSYGPLLGIMILLGIGGGLAGWGRPRPSAAESWLFTLAAIGLLLFPPVFAVYHVRYVLPALPFVFPAGAIGARGIVRRLRHRSSA
jgi:hypothetical protein